MRTIRDLREIINVSRLNYNYDDNGDNLAANNNENERSNLEENLSSKQNKEKNVIKIPKPVNSSKTPVKSNTNESNNNNTTSSSKVNLLLNRNSVPRLSVNNNTKSIILDDDKTRKSLLLSKSIVVSSFSETTNDDMASGDDNVLIVEGNFDEMFTYIDTFIVSEWLNRSNKHLYEMFTWLEASRCESFIHFANFWLTKITDKQGVFDYC